MALVGPLAAELVNDAENIGNDLWEYQDDLGTDEFCDFLDRLDAANDRITDIIMDVHYNGERAAARYESAIMAIQRGAPNV